MAHRSGRVNARRAAGFSMIELSVAVAVILLLSGIVLPVLGDQLDKSKAARAAADAKKIGEAFQKYRLDTGGWPVDDLYFFETILFQYTKVIGLAYAAQREFQGFPCLFKAPAGSRGWNGPYLQNGIKVGSSVVAARPSTSSTSVAGIVDPWGNLYRLVLIFQPKNGAVQVGFVSLVWGGTTTGQIYVYSAGPNGIYETSNAQAATGQASGDDILISATNQLY